MPAELEREQKENLKTSWEIAAVLDFLAVFRPYLNLEHLNFSAEELESCIVLNNGTSGLLPEIHIVSCLLFLLLPSRLYLGHGKRQA